MPASRKIRFFAAERISTIPFPKVGGDNAAHLVDAFRKGMAEQGIVERQNAAVDYRWADSRYKRLAGQAADLLSRQPTVLVSVGGDMTAKVATAATRTTPIVA
ncbi:MAG: hypothetical protein WCF86_17580, partial [Pseudolabrys sp.]